MKFFVVALIALSSLSVFAQDKKESDAISALIKTATALSKQDLSCASNADCGLLPIGKRACGGPNGYLVVSQNNNNITEITYLAERTEVREDEYNSANGVFSICSIEMPPSTSCVKKLCK